MDRQRLGMDGPVGRAIAMVLMLAASGLWPGAVATFAGGPAPAVDGGSPAGKEAGPARSYWGKVIEKGTGRPIAGATVNLERLLFPDPVAGGRRVLHETTHRTDAEGIYRFTIPPEELAEPNYGILVRVKHTSYAPEINYCYNVNGILRNEAFGERLTDHLGIELQRGEPITGVVVTPEGAPAAGILVHSYSYFAPDTKPGDLVIVSYDDVRTDDHGRFRFVAITPGKVVFTLYSARYAVSVHSPEGNKRGDLGRFVLREGIVIKGRVLDADGTPLPGIIVNAAGFSKPPQEDAVPLFHWDSNSAKFSRSTVTDARGEFATGPLPPGFYRVLPVESDDDPVMGDLFRRLPAPFAMRKVTLEEGKSLEPLEIRARPHVVVEARFHDSEGRPARGHNFSLRGHIAPEGKGRRQRGLLTLPEPLAWDAFWNGRSWPDAEGKMVWHAPRGLEDAEVSLMDFFTDERYVFRYRIGTGRPLQYSRDLTLGSLDHDVKDIEIVRYVSPTILVKVVGWDGSKPRGVHVTARYPEDQFPSPDSNLSGEEPLSYVRVAEQEDGRFRSTQLLPDQTVTVRATADGYRERSASLELPEGAIKELELVLDKP